MTVSHYESDMPNVMSVTYILFIIVKYFMTAKTVPKLSTFKKNKNSSTVIT